MTNKTQMPEPVAWITKTKTIGPDYGKEFYAKLPVQSLNPLTYEHTPLITTAQAEAYAAAKVREAQQWQPIETAPKTGRTVLLGFVNSHGNWRTMLGRWVGKEEILNEWEDGDLFDEGWYEISVEADDVPNCWLTNPSHWMPLPPPPVE